MGQKLRQAALAAAAATAIPNKHLAVGSRVGVYWRMDKAFYTVRREAQFAKGRDCRVGLCQVDCR